MNVFSMMFRKLVEGKLLSSCAAALLSSALVFPVLLASPARATDLNTPATRESSDAHYVRLAVNKSAVLHLPADAKEVVVGNNEIVDAIIRNKNTVYLFARKNGQTNLFFFDANGQQILSLDLEVSSDFTWLRKAIQRVLPGSAVTVDMVDSNLILGGTVASPADAKTVIDLANQTTSGTGKSGNIVNLIKVAGEDQVLLQVKIVEIKRTVLKQFGINWQALIDAGSFAFNISNINPFSNSLISEGAGYGVNFQSGKSALTTVLRAMESDGLVHTLAEPNLSSTSGQSAKFSAGGQYPYKECNNGGGTTLCTVTFKDYGIDLDFTPTVMSEGRINIKLHTQSSNLDTSNSGANGIPAISKRSVDTVLELPDGGSMMIAGLISESTRASIAGTPGLKKLPVLGALFRSRDFATEQSELVVLVTPHIVRSVAQQQLVSPDKNLNAASDLQGIVFGRLNKVYGHGPAPSGHYGGDVGYIVE